MPQNYANRIKQTLALSPPVSCPREPRPEGEPCTTYYDFELFCLFVRFSTGCRARSPREKRSGSSAGVVGAFPGRSLGRPAPRGRGLGPQNRAHRLYFQGPVFSPSPDLRREGIVFLRRDHDPETSDSRTSCGSSSSSSSSAQSMLQPTVYNVTTLPRPAAAGNTMRV